MTAERVEREYTHARATALLGRLIGDGRDYGLLLADQRRGRRRCCIPFHRDAMGRTFYIEKDLLAFADAERLRGVTPKPEFRVVPADYDERLLSPLEALHGLDRD